MTVSKTNISKFQFDPDYCQALYHEPLTRVIAQALPVFDIKICIYNLHSSTSIKTYNISSDVSTTLIKPQLQPHRAFFFALFSHKR